MFEHIKRDFFFRESSRSFPIQRDHYRNDLPKSDVAVIRTPLSTFS